MVILSFSINKGEEIQQCAIFDAGNGLKEIVMGVFPYFLTFYKPNK